MNAVKLLDMVITGLTLKENLESGYIKALELVKIATKEGRDITAEELQELDNEITEEYNKWNSH